MSGPRSFIPFGGRPIVAGGVLHSKYPQDGLTVINKSGSAISADKLVAVVGFDTTTEKPKVVLADANDRSHRSVYVALDAIANNTVGHVWKGGPSAANLNTNSASAAGDPVYLSETAGAFTVTKPSTASIFPVGWVVTKSATVGEIDWYIMDPEVSADTLTPGAGVSAAETNKSGISIAGDLIHTRLVVDLTGLVGSATDLDIIGNTGGAASAHFGQITAAKSGTIVGGKVTCLEVPAGGTADIDFYSANESTGAQDALVTSLVETVLITAGGAWTSGAVKGMTTVPPANDYLYITNGAAAGGTFTAGKFLIELWGTPA
jgi:hypothetical protein